MGGVTRRGSSSPTSSTPNRSRICAGFALNPTQNIAISSLSEIVSSDQLGALLVEITSRRTDEVNPVALHPSIACAHMGRVHYLSSAIRIWECDPIIEVVEREHTRIHMVHRVLAAHAQQSVAMIITDVGGDGPALEWLCLEKA
jgi:hypothetical protein